MPIMKPVDRLGDRNSVERDDARRRNVIDVPGTLPDRFWLKVDRELCGINQLIAPEAADARNEWADRDVDASDDAVVVNRDLDADLDAWDQRLFHDLVDEVTSRVRVGREEDVVALAQGSEDGRVVDLLGELTDDDGGVGASSIAGRDVHLRCTNVLGLGCDEPGQVRFVDVLGVDENKVTNAEPGNELGDEAACATEADDCDAHGTEDVLASVAVHPGLPSHRSSLEECAAGIGRRRRTLAPGTTSSPVRRGFRRAARRHRLRRHGQRTRAITGFPVNWTSAGYPRAWLSRSTPENRTRSKAAVVVDREVHEPFVVCLGNAVAHEVGGERVP